MNWNVRTPSSVNRPIACLVTGMAMLFCWPASVQAQVFLDFDNNGSIEDFEFFGFAATEWTVDPNPLVDDSLALHTNSNGEQLDPWFSRVAVLNADVFEAINVEVSIDLTWDDDDRAGVYLRFVDEDNWYYLRLSGGDRTSTRVDLWRSKDGVVEPLMVGQDISPVATNPGDTRRITFRAEGDQLTGLVDGVPIPGIDPFVDPDPLIALGRVGVGQNTNPTYYDNFALANLDASGPTRLDFDNTGTLADFTFFGFAATEWTVDPNPLVDDSLALHTNSNGEQLDPWFSRVAVLNADVFDGVNVEVSVDLTWDDDDRAGVYLRFVDEDNWYYLRLSGGDRTSTRVDLWRSKDGVVEPLMVGQDISPVPTNPGDTRRITFRAVGDQLSGFVDGVPIPGIDPFTDPDPLIARGRIGVGQNTNPTYYDNFELTTLDSFGLQPNVINAAPGDEITVTMAIPGSCNLTRDVTYTLVSSDPGVVTAEPVTFAAGRGAIDVVVLNIIGSGTATLTTTNDGGCADLAPATVTVETIQSLVLELAPSLALGESTQAAAIGDFGPLGTRTLRTGTTYSSENPDVATVDDDGVVTGVGNGVANITATNDGISATAPILVATSLVDALPEFTIEVWAFVFVGHDTGRIQREVVGTIPPFCTVTLPVVNVEDVVGAAGHDRITPDDLTPCLEPPGVEHNDTIFRATGFIEIKSLEPITFGYVFDVAALLSIDGQDIVREDVNTGDGGQLFFVPPWTPSRTGLLPIELIVETANSPFYLEFTQDVGDGEHVLVNDPNDDRSLRVFSRGCPPGITQVSHVFSDPINLAAADVGTGERVPISVVIPGARDGFVTVSSSNADVAGNTDIQFAAFAEPCFGGEIEITGTGTTQLTLTNDMGFANGPPRELNVVPIQSIDLRLASVGMELGDTQQARVVGDFGAAGTRDITDGDRFGTMYASSDPAVVTVDPVTGLITAVGLGTAEITADNESTSVKSIVVADQLTRIAFLAGDLDLNEADAAAIEHLGGLRFVGDPGQLDANGAPPRVEIFDDTAFDPDRIDADFDLVITSSTVDGSAVAGRFRCLSIPHVFWEPDLHREGREGMSVNGGMTNPRFDAMGRCTSHFSFDDPMRCQELFAELFILDPGHPITQGLPIDAEGFLRVYPAPGHFFSYAATGDNAAQAPGTVVFPVRVAAGATSLAEFDFEAESTLMVAEAGGQRVDGTSIFRGRRVSLWLSDNSFGDLNDAGRTLVSRSIDWALGGVRLPITPTDLIVAGPSRIGVGATAQLLVAGVGDACTQGVGFDPATTYASSDASVATIDAEGVVRGVGEGTVTLTATFDGLSASTDMLVQLDALLVTEMDFDTTGPTATNEIPVFFDLFGFDAVVGAPGWEVNTNRTNPDDSSNALQITSVGGQLTDQFSRVAVVRPALFQAEDMEVSADITWEDGVRAGVYARFLDQNNWYYLTADAKAAGDPQTDEVFDLFRRKNGFDTQLIIDTSTPVVIAAGDTRTVTFRVEGNQLFGFVNGQPIPGIDPFVDADPIIGVGTGGVGEQNNATFFDNLSLQALVSITGPPPALVRIMGGLGSAADTFTSPLGENVPFTTVDIDLSADSDLVSGPGTLTQNGGGNHTLTLDTPVPVGGCMTVTFDVADSTTGVGSTITITLCHLPLDVNQDGTVNIADITAWGAEFNGARRPALVDTNGDGNVNVQDATAVGDNWFGRPPATKPWNGERLP